MFNVFQVLVKLFIFISLLLFISYMLYGNVIEVLSRKNINICKLEM